MIEWSDWDLFGEIIGAQSKLIASVNNRHNNVRAPEGLRAGHKSIPNDSAHIHNIINFKLRALATLQFLENPVRLYKLHVNNNS